LYSKLLKLYFHFIFIFYVFFNKGNYFLLAITFCVKIIYNIVVIIIIILIIIFLTIDISIMVTVAIVFAINMLLWINGFQLIKKF
jgi:hypothetical protein